jgi:hypothetical protein
MNRENDVINPIYLVHDCWLRILTYCCKKKSFLRLVTVCKDWKKIIFLVPHLTVTSDFYQDYQSHLDVKLFTNLTSLKMLAIDREHDRVMDISGITTQIRFNSFLHDLNSRVTTLTLKNNCHLTLPFILYYFKHLTTLNLYAGHHLEFRHIAKISTLKHVKFYETLNSVFLDELYLLDHIELVEFEIHDSYKDVINRSGKTIIYIKFPKSACTTLKGHLIHGEFDGIVTILSSMDIYGEKNVPMIYKGNVKDFYMHGKGKLELYHSTDKSPYWDGNWIQNNLAHGSKKYPDGSIYTGNFVFGKRHGKGLLIHGNGDQSKGDWNDDFFHGLITTTYNTTGIIAHINYKNGKRHGKAVFVFNQSSNLTFKGKYKENELYKGKWFENNEITCKGKFKQGIFQRGFYLSHDKKFIIIGSFDENDVFKGSVYKLKLTQEEELLDTHKERDVYKFDL